METWEFSSTAWVDVRESFTPSTDLLSVSLLVISDTLRYFNEVLHVLQALLGFDCHITTCSGSRTDVSTFSF